MSDSTSLSVNLSAEAADAPPEAAVRTRIAERSLGIIVPILTVVVLVVLWQLLVIGAEIPQYILPSPLAVAEIAGVRLGHSLTGALGDNRDHLHLAGIGADRRRRLCDFPGAIALDRTRLLSARRHPAGDADRCDRTVDPDLRADPRIRAADLRLPRRLLSNPLQHGASA